jgi:mRNA-degrading endonuclease HigB of HigAB toxin-antitoxin module
VRLYGIRILEKLKRKNRGNAPLKNAIDELIKTIEKENWKNPNELAKSRSDADCVHSEGFYFFNIKIHRTMIFIEFEDDKATVIWAGSHKDYEKTFQNNRNVIEKWLRANSWIK